MSVDRRELRAMLERDAEEVPLGTLTIPGRLRTGRHLLGDLADHFPHPHAVERYVLAVITRRLKQHGSELCLGSRFVDAVATLDPALPEPVRKTLDALADHAKVEPFSVGDATLVAHSICMDGEFRAWLLGTPPPRKRTGKGDANAAYRQLAQRLHPDRQGGDAEAMALLNQLRDAGAR